MKRRPPMRRLLREARASGTMRTRTSEMFDHRWQAFLNPSGLRRPDDPIPGGRGPAPHQDDLHEVQCPEPTTGDALPEVQIQGTPPEGQGGPDGVSPPRGDAVM